MTEPETDAETETGTEPMPNASAAGERGQATAEYALVMLAAAALAGLLLAWATRTDAVGRLMDAVLDTVIADVVEPGDQQSAPTASADG